ncbi:MAG: ETC complex I subunit [Proteobacteria bacterium]|nr:ETC complex I subunit [Pseudomonadota bacterium]
MKARIYQPAKTAMQSGRAGTRRWRLEYDAEKAREIDPLMGWTSSADMPQQVSLSFESRDQAVAFADKRGIPYYVEEPQLQTVRPKSYAENFRYDRAR